MTKKTNDRKLESTDNMNSRKYSNIFLSMTVYRLMCISTPTIVCILISGIKKPRISFGYKYLSIVFVDEQNIFAWSFDSSTIHCGSRTFYMNRNGRNIIYVQYLNGYNNNNNNRSNIFSF